MPVNYPPYSKFRLAAPALCLLVVLAFASNFTLQAPDGPNIFGFDKVAHFFVFGLVGTLWFRFMAGELRSGKRLLKGLLAVALCGFFDEWVQSMNPVRSAELADWTADMLGGLVAVFVYRSWSWYRELLEMTLWKRGGRGKS